jgi:hypothetical protein
VDKNIQTNVLLDGNILPDDLLDIQPVVSLGQDPLAVELTEFADGAGLGKGTDGGGGIIR